MFALSLIDKDKNMLDLLTSRSQVKIDDFTTRFENENEFLEELNIDAKLYKIVIENRINHRKVLFTDRKYRNVVYLNDNVEKEKEFLSKVVDVDINLLKDYFKSEILRFEKDELSDYEKGRLKSLKKINAYFNNEENKDYYRVKLLSLLKPYFYLNYDYLKGIYIFLIDNGIDFEKNNETNLKEPIKQLLDEMKEKIKNVKDLNDDKFLSNIGLRKYIDRDTIYFEDDEILDFFSGDYDDEDEERAELEMFMDSKNYTDTRKKRILEEVLSLK